MVALVATLSSPAVAADKWYVQFSDVDFDESSVRRAVALELREVEIPSDPRSEGETPDDVSLHISVERDDGTLTVSLWDRGEFAGRRKVSASSQPRILARRVGLAVGELGRQLAARRYRLGQMLTREEFLADQREIERLEEERRRALGLIAEVNAVILPRGAFLVGPGVGVEFNQQFPLRFSPVVSWMAGTIPALAENTLGLTAPQWSVLDLGVNTDYLVTLGPRTRLTLGGLLFVSAVHVGGATEVDEISFQRDTYTARAGGRVGLELAAFDGVRLRGILTGGSLLRSIPMRQGYVREDLGGGFVGLSIGATLAPRAPQGASAPP